MHHLHRNEFIVLKIIETPHVKEKTITATAEVYEIINQTNRIGAKGKWSVTILRNEKSQIPQAGDRILISKQIGRAHV